MLFLDKILKDPLEWKLTGRTSLDWKQVAVPLNDISYPYKIVLEVSTGQDLRLDDIAIFNLPCKGNI